MRILITGASGGIGTAVTRRFLDGGHQVWGIDLRPASLSHRNYTHYTLDLLYCEELPAIPDIEVLFLNAGTQNSGDDIDNNLKAAIRASEYYLKENDSLRSVLFNASASSVSGQEFPVYAASKAGIVGYMRNLAIRLAPRGITCNAISLGGVYSPLNNSVTTDPETWERIMDVTPMKKWTELEEVADWVEFLTVKNRSMSGENLLIDNGEYRLRSTFVWPGPTDTVSMILP